MSLYKIKSSVHRDGDNFDTRVMILINSKTKCVYVKASDYPPNLQCNDSNEILGIDLFRNASL
jgi:hypothetical protein